MYMYISACIYPYSLVHHNAGFSPHASVYMHVYARCLPEPLTPAPIRAAVSVRVFCIALLFQAMSRTVAPSVSQLFGSAPFSMRASAWANWLVAAATMSGVAPFF